MCVFVCVRARLCIAAPLLLAETLTPACSASELSVYMHVCYLCMNICMQYYTQASLTWTTN